MMYQLHSLINVQALNCIFRWSAKIIQKTHLYKFIKLQTTCLHYYCSKSTVLLPTEVSANLQHFLILTCRHHVAYYSHNISGMKAVIYTPVCWRILVRRRHVTHLLLTSALVPLLPRLLALCHCCPLQR